MFNRIMRLVIAAAVGVGALALAPAAMADDDGDRYRVTIKNLTRGQAFSPPVVALHDGKDQLFEVGQPASVGIREIAENGNNAPLLAFLAADPFDRIGAFLGGSAPLVPTGRFGGVQDPPAGPEFPDVATFTIEADDDASRLSFATMLICTNDGFTGVNGLKLPRKEGRSVSAYTAGYDAHTEQNTQDFAHIVPPCQLLIGGAVNEPGQEVSNPALAEGGVITHHAGIQNGVGDLSPSVHGWTNPVAKVKVTALDD
jgi:hypothetical protein